MKAVDRANYVVDKRHAYEDSPQCVTHFSTPPRTEPPGNLIVIFLLVCTQCNVTVKDR